MDLTIIYTKTGRGTRALIKKLPPTAGQVLSVLSTNVSAEEILQKLKKVNERDFELAITWLLEGGFIKTVVKEPFPNSIWAPVSQSSIEVSEISFDEFNQTKEKPDNNKQPDSNLVDLAKARAKAETEAKEKAEAKAKADALARADAEARERAEAQAKAETEAKEKAEAKAKADALARADAEARERAEAQAKAETEAKEKAEAKAKADALARADAEARERAEAQAKAETEAKEKAEAKAKADALARADAEARERAEAQAKAETEAKEKAEAKAKADALARADAEARERAEAQAKAETEAKEKAEAKAKADALARADAEARERAEAQAKAETEAKEKAEAKAKADALARADAEARERAEAQAKAETEAKEKAEEEEAATKAAAKAEAKALARAEALAKAEAQENARAEAIAKEKAEAAAKKRAEEEARAVAEALAKAEAIAKEKAEAAAKSKAEALEKSEARAKKKAATKAKLEKIKHNAALQIQKLTNTSVEKFQTLHRRIGSIKIKKASKQWLPYFFTIIKAIFIYSTALLILLVVAAQFINMHILIKPIENAVFENIQEPVKIEAVYISMYPTPHLMLKNMSIGNSATANAQMVRVFPVLSSLKEKMGTASTMPYEIESIEIEGLNLSQNDLPRPIAWVKAFSKLNQLKIKEILLKNTFIHLNGIELPAINGDIQLNPIGQFDSGILRTEDKSLVIEIKDAQSNYQINIKALKWRSPMPPNLVFDELDANGILENDTLTLSPIKGILYEGNLKANMVVDLTGAGAIKGDFEINGVNLTDMALELKLNSVIDGTLNTNANFSFNLDTSSNQIEAPTINAHFKINNGFIRKIDLIEAMRTNNLGGSTHFTEFSGDFLLSNQSYQFRNLSLQDNQLQANGTFNISPQKTVAGDIYSKIMLKANPIKSRLIITGTTDNLVLKK